MREHYNNYANKAIEIMLSQQISNGQIPSAWRETTQISAILICVTLRRHGTSLLWDIEFCSSNNGKTNVNKLYFKIFCRIWLPRKFYIIIWKEKKNFQYIIIDRCIAKTSHSILKKNEVGKQLPEVHKFPLHDVKF